MQGLIIYSNKDKDKNLFFINKIKNIFKNYDIPIIYFDEEDINDIDLSNFSFAIYRGRNYQISEYLLKRGIRVFNNSLTNKIANNKLLSDRLFIKLQLPHLNTFENVEEIQKFPCVMKSIDGHGGSEVFLINDKEESAKIIKELNKKFIYQNYLDIDCDIRVYALKNNIICAIKRTNKNDFRYNFSLGGEIELIEIDEEIASFVNKIYEQLDFDFIGIDIFKKDNKYYLNELEDPVGNRMVYQLTNIDIIKLFADYIYKKLISMD